MPVQRLRVASFAFFVSALLAGPAGCQTTGRPLIEQPQSPGFSQPRELASQEDPEGAACRAASSEKTDATR